MQDVDRMRQLFKETGSCRKVAEIMCVQRIDLNSLTAEIVHPDRQN